MSEMGFRRILKSGVFQWPWPTSHGLAIITGAAGGGGGGALCIQRLNFLAQMAATAARQRK